MTYQQVIQQARGQMGPCKACPVCDGKGCRGTIPGPGAKGIGDTAIGPAPAAMASGAIQVVTPATTSSARRVGPIRAPRLTTVFGSSRVATWHSSPRRSWT